MRVWLVVFAVVVCGCGGGGRWRWHQYSVDTSLPSDTQIDRWLSPYRDSIRHLMSETLAVALAPVCKRPDGLSELSQMVAWAQLWSVKRRVEQRARAGVPVISVINYHGLRVRCVDSGLVSVGDIYELMPFDNELVVAEGSCSVAQWLIREVQRRGGWGLVILNEKALARADTCVVVLSDYLAGGGSHLDRLKGATFESTGMLVRDAIIRYVDTLNVLGKSLRDIWGLP